MASLTVNPTNYNITDIGANSVKIYFNTDVTLNDIKLSTNNGQSFINNINMSQSSASFDISHLGNNNYTCLLKGFYEEIESGGGSGGTTNYSVTNNLTNCTNSNTNSSVSSGSSYSATITANSGYIMNTIIVTMGGNDITNSVVSGNNIYIGNVTGNIVITANATQQQTGGGGTTGNGITTSKNNYTIPVGTGFLEVPVTITANLPSYLVWEVRQNGSYFLYCYKSGNNINVDTSSLGTGIYDNLTIVAKENNSGSYVDVATSNTFSITVGNGNGSGGSGSSTTPISINYINNINVSPNTSFEITYSTNIDATKHEISYDEGNSFVQIYPSSSGTTYKFMHEGVSSQWSEYKRIIRVTDSNNNTATSNKFTIYVNSSGSGGSSGNVNTNSLVLNMQHASSHNCIPNCPESIDWKYRPRMGHGIAIPNSYQDGQPWKAFGQWLTVYKENGKQLVENVGVELTDFKMWRYNENTNQWVLVNDTFDYGSFYLEDFWDDGNAPLNSNKILSSDKKTYKCLMNSATQGRCFHPFSSQKNWSDYGFSGSPSYVVSQVKFRLIKWDENGVDNRANANLCVDVGGDYWIYKGASFDSQWRHNGDFAIGNYIKATSEWQYAYATTCPQSWNKGFPVDTI